MWGGGVVPGLSDRDMWTRNSPHFKGIAIYNEGSKMEKLRNSFKQYNDCRVFQEEIFANKKCIELLANRNSKLNRPVTIYIAIVKLS